MESMREFNRVMEREIAKGGCPLKLEAVEVNTNEYQQIETMEKLYEAVSYFLRIGKYQKYATRTVNDNVYMEMKGKAPVFTRTRMGMERVRIYRGISRYCKKKMPIFDSRVVVEKAQCIFSLPQEDLSKYQYRHEGKETYAFVLSDKYIRALYAHCLVERQNVALTFDRSKINEMDLQWRILSLDAVKNVLFQCLLMDDVQMNEDGKIVASLYTIYQLQE